MYTPLLDQFNTTIVPYSLQYAHSNLSCKYIMYAAPISSYISHLLCFWTPFSNQTVTFSSMIAKHIPHFDQFITAIWSCTLRYVHSNLYCEYSILSAPFPSVIPHLLYFWTPFSHHTITFSSIIAKYLPLLDHLNTAIVSYTLCCAHSNLSCKCSMLCIVLMVRL